MVGYAQPKPQTQNKYPFDTGCRFNGVKVRLECSSRDAAEKLGRSLAAKGLPHEEPDRLIQHRLAGKRVVLGREEGGDLVYLCWPTQASGNIVVLETADTMIVEPFVRWLRSVYPKPEAPKAGPVTTLNQLADAGEIDVINAG